MRTTQYLSVLFCNHLACKEIFELFNVINSSAMAYNAGYVLYTQFYHRQV